VERSLTGTGGWAAITGSPTAINAQTKSDTGLTCNTTYYYRVRATNAGGDSTNITANTTTSPCPGVAIGAATLAASAGNITGQAAKTPAEAVALCNNVPLPSGYTFPFGAFVYNVTGLAHGGTTNMTLTLPGTLPVGSKIFKCSSLNQWVELTNTSDNGDAVVIYALTDGLSNTDHDGSPNTTIVDPVIIGLKKSASAVGGVAELISVPTASTNGLSYLAGLAGVVMLVGAGWLVSQR